MNTDISSLTLDHIENEAKVNEVVVEALTQPEQAGEPITPMESSIPTNPIVSDGKGGFDPAIHEVDANGNPRITKDGSFRRKRGRRNASSGGTVPSISGTGSAQTGDSSGPRSGDYAATAGFLCDLAFGGAIATFGDEWKPSDSERNNIVNAATRYCEANDFGDLPPGIALCMACGIYALPRLNTPKTKEKLRAIGVSLGIVKDTPRAKQETKQEIQQTII